MSLEKNIKTCGLLHVISLDMVKRCTLETNGH